MKKLKEVVARYPNSIPCVSAEFFTSASKETKETTNVLVYLYQCKSDSSLAFCAQGSLELFDKRLHKSNLNKEVLHFTGFTRKRTPANHMTGCILSLKEGCSLSLPTTDSTQLRLEIRQVSRFYSQMLMKQVFTVPGKGLWLPYYGPVLRHFSGKEKAR